MGDILNFDYYYGIEAEQFSFYRIPRILMKDKHFKVLSSDAKLLYGLMLDRMSVSITNGWLDEENRAYIYYTVESIMEDLGCSRGTSAKILSELDSKKGIGLIERKRQGLGKPDIIYVKNFVTIEKMNEEELNKEKEMMDTSKECQISNNSTSGNPENEFQEIQNLDFQKSKNQISRSSENGFQEVQNLDFWKSKNQTSRSPKNEPNYINNNYNNSNHIDIDIESHQLELIEDKDKDMDKIDSMDNTHAYIQLIKENIEYDYFVQYGERKKRELYDELFEVICDVVCVPRVKVRIGKEDYPYQLVKAKFLKLKSEHLEYVIECMQNIGTRIGSMKAYMITSLYNAPNTLNHYYQQEVKQDAYGGL